MNSHRFPQPMWNATDETIIFDETMSHQLGKKQCAPNEIIYIPNNTVYDRLTNRGQSRVWASKAPFIEYPKAMHGPDNQSVTVYGPDEEAAALANGWALKPDYEEKPLELPPSPFRAPKMQAPVVINEEPAKRGPGRPKVSA